MASPIRRIEDRDRRSDHRYPMNVELKYRLVRRDKTVMTGSVLLQTCDPLPCRQKIELSVFWQARLDNITPLQLHYRPGGTQRRYRYRGSD
jgi:hypothetical protein